MEANQQVKTARAALRSAIFELVRNKLVGDRIGLHLLQTVEHTLRADTDPRPTIGVPNTLYIEDEDKPDIWRAYPCDETTIEELHRACAAFPVRPWVDLDCRVCLILTSAAITGVQPPTAIQLAEAMYGMGDMAQWPAEEVKKWTPPEL